MTDKKYTVLKISVITLIILNSILIAKFCLFDDNHPQERQNQKPDKFLIEELKLTDQQIVSYQKLIQLHRDTINVLIDEGRKWRQVYFKSLKSDKIDSVTYNNSLVKIKENQQSIEEVTFKHFFDLKKALNSEQQLKFNLVIDEVLQKMSPPLRRKD
jgi:Spy/CpxP family protein refolding chaperone